VAPVPLLWIAPLVVYLITFILAFESDRWYRRWLWFAALFVCSFAACKSWRMSSSEQFSLQISIHLALLLIVGMICHGEVVRLRPATKYLTTYYLCLAAGGAIGGLFVAVLAPQMFTDYYELPLALLATWLLAMCVLATDRMSPLYKGQMLLAWMVIVAVTTLLAIRIQAEYWQLNATSLQAVRNFFGVLKVQEGDVGTGQRGRFLLHGRISHGMQYLDPARRREATQYYIRASGIGQLLDSLAGDKSLRVGVVGLGAGTLATYANAGNEFTFYDINPQVVEFADRYFTFLGDARERGVNLQIVTDDARLALERESPQKFDVLALDAFSGDAIPVHLLTMEAFEQYLRHLRQPGGVLAVHITNRNLDLAPVVQAAADRFNLEARVVKSSADPSAASQVTLWVLLYPRDDTSGRKRIGELLEARPGGVRPIVWTDDYSSLWSVLKRK
jgi:predicted O-methyltransferase YrrM